MASPIIDIINNIKQPGTLMMLATTSRTMLTIAQPPQGFLGRGRPAGGSGTGAGCCPGEGAGAIR